MKRLSWLLILLTGCMANRGLDTSGAAHDNISNLSRISVGMSESQVLQIMRHPYSQRTFDHEGDTYDVWFYVTRPTVLGQSRLVPQNLTPLTFKNGVLTGWGFDYYSHLLKQEELGAQKKARTPAQIEEDDALEKALQAPSPSPGQHTAPPPKSTTPSAPAPARPAPPTREQPPPPPSKTPSQPSDDLGPRPVQPPVQPTPQQPPPPNQPAPGQPRLPVSFSTPEAGGDVLGMCSRPSSSPPQKKPPAQEQGEEEGEASQEKPYLDEEGGKMIEEENEQNFNFW